MFIGLILVVVGIIALLVKLGVLTGSVWSYLWPVILIIIGLFFLLGRGRGRRYHRWFDSGCCGHAENEDESDKRG